MIAKTIAITLPNGATARSGLARARPPDRHNRGPLRALHDRPEEGCTEVVEFRVEAHNKVLKERLAALAAVVAGWPTRPSVPFWARLCR
jgi:hypothetical protein